MTGLSAPAELPKALEVLLCFGADREAETELLPELGRSDVLRLFAATLQSSADHSVKEKFAVLMQHFLKR